MQSSINVIYVYGLVVHMYICGVCVCVGVYTHKCVCK